MVVELIGHLLLPPSRKSMFRKSMGSGDNGKPHKRSRHGNERLQGSRMRPCYARYIPSPSANQGQRQRRCELLAIRKR